MATILIADDMAAMRRLLRLTLTPRHEVLESEDGAEAFESIQRHRPSVVILDVVMPGLSGLQICRLLRGDADLRTIGIIIVSANANAQQAHEAGADRFITKPFSPSSLLATVDELLASRARTWRH
jgi:CheY-like chemotaxis protein